MCYLICLGSTFIIKRLKSHEYIDLYNLNVEQKRGSIKNHMNDENSCFFISILRGTFYLIDEGFDGKFITTIRRVGYVIKGE